MYNINKEDQKKVQNMKTIAIIGGGVSGTILSLKLSKENFKIILFEKQNFIGGLSSSLQIKNYSLDFGPHIISLPSNSKIFYDIKHLMNENIILLSNLSEFTKIFYQNKIWDSFPNLSNVIFNSGKIFLIKAFSGLITTKKDKLNQKTSVDYLTNTFGKFLYNEWFKPFIFNRFTNQNPPLEIIKELFPPMNLKKVLQNKITISNKKTKNGIDEDINFYFKYGMGSFIERIKTEIEKYDGVIKTNCEIQSISHKDIKEISYTHDNKINKINVDAIVYTIPIPFCLQWFDSQNVELQNKKSKNFHCIMIFLMIDSPQNEKFWIINVFDPKKIFFRISQQNFLSKHTIPLNKSVLCIEIRCLENDSIWNKTSEEIFFHVKTDLETMNIFNLDKIENYEILKIMNIYAFEGYEKKYENLKKFINSHKNEYAVGNIEGDTGRLTDISQNKENVSLGGINLAFFNAEDIVKKIKNEFKGL